MGYKGMIAEGAKHILGWKSPHFVYHCAQNPNLKLLLRDYKLSDDISLRFNDSSWNEYPLFADTYMDWIAQLPEEEKVINIFMELCALGIYQPLSSNILEFIKALPAVAKDRGITFSFPSEIVSKSKSVAPMEVPFPMSWNDEERDTSCWLGNVMQREAFHKLYSVADRVLICKDRRITQDWDRIQASNNFRFMTTKNMGVGFYRGIYDSPYDAFTNYMNILGDFINRVNALYPLDIENDELNALLTTIRNQADEINVKDAEITRLQARLQKFEPVEKAAPAKKATPTKKAAPAKKAEPKAEVKKATPAKKEPAKKASPAKKAEPKAEVKKAEPAKKVPAKKAPAKKAPAKK
jgi:alpha-amylase